MNIYSISLCYEANLILMLVYHYHPRRSLDNAFSLFCFEVSFARDIRPYHMGHVTDIYGLELHVSVCIQVKKTK